MILCFFSCKDVNKTKNEQVKSDEKMVNGNKVDTNKDPTLKSILDEKKNNFELKADEKTKSIYKEGIDAVRSSGILENAKQVGEIAPNFKLKNAIGNTVELTEYLKKGPVVLVWYRGGWCPYCNLTLHQLQEELPNFIANGASLIAISPELPDNSVTTSQKNNLEFEVLSDIGNTIAKKYGVVFKLTSDVSDIYNNKFNLTKYNGDDSSELPLAATYIINQEGEIIYAFLDADYRNRAEPSELTNVLKNIGNISK
ncbi:peroxiredoxin-like family protein [Flavicella sp.]|uniref:peroxiredoxin-like family protein n=1 Tax=Flavicella sp. TaxID=2957742 RepID=UPI00301ADD2B